MSTLATTPLNSQDEQGETNHGLHGGQLATTAACAPLAMWSRRHADTPGHSGGRRSAHSDALRRRGAEGAGRRCCPRGSRSSSRAGWWAPAVRCATGGGVDAHTGRGTCNREAVQQAGATTANGNLAPASAPQLLELTRSVCCHNAGLRKQRVATYTVCSPTRVLFCNNVACLRTSTGHRKDACSRTACWTSSRQRQASLNLRSLFPKGDNTKPCDASIAVPLWLTRGLGHQGAARDAD